MAVNVLGSRYALLIDDLEMTDTGLALARTKVAIGRSRGKVGSTYVKGHVDKACLEVVADSGNGETDEVEIGLIAKVIEPYAVFVRN